MGRPVVRVLALLAIALVEGLEVGRHRPANAGPIDGADVGCGGEVDWVTYVERLGLDAGNQLGGALLDEEAVHWALLLGLAEIDLDNRPSLTVATILRVGPGLG